MEDKCGPKQQETGHSERGRRRGEAGRAGSCPQAALCRGSCSRSGSPAQPQLLLVTFTFQGPKAPCLELLAGSISPLGCSTAGTSQAHLTPMERFAECSFFKASTHSLGTAADADQHPALTQSPAGPPGSDALSPGKGARTSCPHSGALESPLPSPRPQGVSPASAERAAQAVGHGEELFSAHRNPCRGTAALRFPH